MSEIYLDNCATTRVDDDTAAVALELMTETYGNPSSLHSKGYAAQLRLDGARRQLAGALGCHREEVFFTGGGTEGNNLALLGGAAARSRRGKTVVAMSFEHASVLGPLRQLEQQGCTLRLVDPLPDGNIDAAAFLAAVDSDTILASCMLVNSELGTVAPLAQLSRELRRKAPHALFHSDLVQAFCKLPFTPSGLGVDLATVSAHKIHAPKGCGALYIRRGVRILPRTYGGSQENSLRPGTENVPLACAFGHSAAKMAAALPQHLAHARELYDYFVNKVGQIPGLCINSPPNGAPYLCNLSMPGYRSEILLHYLAEREIYISSGSACSKGAASHVLGSMGLPRQRIDSALRVSFSKDTTLAQLDAFFSALTRAMTDIAHK